ncbi:putative zinc-binding protein [Sporomusa sphaeroides]|uniref:putative zinc-binding protein n=1 Tax=Sporomusa sphaeroides TaxID=47679 RepID=UPI002C7ADB7F|nr:putative zinc-binding protein [Sporomusa sphaeroides]HML35218.1 putative zinc-binding protein [Sporomusa sphaeroides]
MDNCTCSATPTLFFACSGGSNVGQLANDACRELTREGVGKLFCLAGIGGHISGIVESAKASSTAVAVDGCGVKCALKALEAANVPIAHHTDWGIEKNGNLFPEAAAVQKAKQIIQDNCR